MEPVGKIYVNTMYTHEWYERQQFGVDILKWLVTHNVHIYKSPENCLEKKEEKCSNI